MPETLAVADHLLETTCGCWPDACTRGDRICHKEGCELDIQEHPRVPDHEYVGCDTSHGIPGEEPGCYGADICHADECGLTRSDHPQPKRVAILVDPGEPRRRCGHTYGISWGVSARVSLLYRLYLLWYGNIHIRLESCIGEDGRPLHDNATFGVLRRLPPLR